MNGHLPTLSSCGISKDSTNLAIICAFILRLKREYNGHLNGYHSV